jgi:hypothetical protein
MREIPTAIKKICFLSEKEGKLTLDKFVDLVSFTSFRGFQMFLILYWTKRRIKEKF